MDEVEVDREAVQSGEARLAVAADRLRATVRYPRAVGSRHAALRHDPCARVRAAAPKTARQQPLVVAELVLTAAVRVRSVEHGDAGLGGGRDRLERELLVAVLVRRHPHAAEADAELGRVKPSRAIQETERIQ